MVFTDKDLERLRESIGDGYGWWHEHLKTTGLQSLLARLEAAEVICRAFAHDCPDNSFVEAWRKSCGR